MKLHRASFAFTRAVVAALVAQLCISTLFGWQADNGNGTFTNPLFYEEHSDPDMIRVGEDFYLTGTTMHVMPGLPILHSRDLVNWRLIGYAFDRLDLGPAFRLRTSQWIELDGGDLTLLSLVTHRYLAISPKDRTVAAGRSGPAPDRLDGCAFTWKVHQP